MNCGSRAAPSPSWNLQRIKEAVQTAEHPVSHRKTWLHSVSHSILFHIITTCPGQPTIKTICLLLMSPSRTCIQQFTAPRLYSPWLIGIHEPTFQDSNSSLKMSVLVAITISINGLPLLDCALVPWHPWNTSLPVNHLCCNLSRAWHNYATTFIPEAWEFQVLDNISQCSQH